MAPSPLTPDSPPALPAGFPESLRPSVGLEIHVRLLTGRKLFCGCRNAFQEAPNNLTCPVCLGLPGSLPVLNEEAVELALRVGLALECQVLPMSEFARKHYFYPDLPRNYQITQYEYPLAVAGRLEVTTEQGSLAARIQRLHLEEDAGRSRRSKDRPTRMDLNRAGTPLVEIVTEPDLAGGGAARQWLRSLRQLLVYLEVSDGSMEQGSLRCDANVGFQTVAGDQSAVGLARPWTEIKNLNSFRAVSRAVDHEILRLAEMVACGERPCHQTRAWDPDSARTTFLRSKEGVRDYLFLPEPDLPWLRLPDGLVQELSQKQPELPWARESRFRREYGLAPDAAVDLCREPAVATYFEETVAALGSILDQDRGNASSQIQVAGLAAAWIRTEMLGTGDAGRRSGTPGVVSSKTLAELLTLVASAEISARAAKEVLALLKSGDCRSPKRMVADLDLAQIDDPEAIAGWCGQVLAQHPQQVANFRSGKTGLLDFLVGQVLAASGGRAHPARVRKSLRDLLENDS